PRYPKMHPCGLVLSRQPMDEITPCFISAKGYPTTHFDMDSVEAVGLIKMDILAQGGLAVMRDVFQMRSAEGGVRNEDGSEPLLAPVRSPGFSRPDVFGRRNAEGGMRSVPNAECGVRSAEPENRNERIAESKSPKGPDMAAIVNRESSIANALALPSPAGPFDDGQVWDLIANGGARAVHHIESPAMISLCKMCNVRDIDTLIAIVSVIRPGAANESKKMEFARRYQKLSPVHYPHPSLEPCLRSTYGLVVYEEHILQ